MWDTFKAYDPLKLYFFFVSPYIKNKIEGINKVRLEGLNFKLKIILANLICINREIIIVRNFFSKSGYGPLRVQNPHPINMIWLIPKFAKWSYKSI